MAGKQKKNKNKNKKQKAQELENRAPEESLAPDERPADDAAELSAPDSSDETLESVSGSLEMAEKAMDFFESDGPLEIEAEENENQEASASDEELLDDDATVVSASEEVTDTAVESSEDAAGEEANDEGSEAPLEMMEEDDQQELIADEGASEDFVDHNQMISVLESLLFASDRPVGLGIFKTVFKGTNVKSKDIRNGLEELAGSYADESRGVTLEEIGNGWQLRTKVDNHPFLTKLGKSKPFKLSGPALEVLSILAYKQPLVKSELDHIRGVESGHLVRALMDRGLVSFQGKSELPGKPMQYGTTRKFLEIFGLRNLKELPSLEEIDQLIPEGIGYDDEDEKLSDVTDSMSETVSDKYSEGEDELEKITEKLGGIDTSSEFFEVEKQRQKDKREHERARDIQEALDLGEDVEDKDVRWLERRDQKIAEAELAASEEQAFEAGASEGVATTDEEGVEVADAEGEPLSEALDALSEESVSMELAPAPTEVVQQSEENGETDGDSELAFLDAEESSKVDPFEDMES